MIIGGAPLGTVAIGGAVSYPRGVAARLLTTEVLAAAEAMSQSGQWATLYDIQIDASTWVYKTDYQIPLLYNGTTYNPYPIAIDDVETTAKPEFKTFNVTVGNIDMAIGNYLENGKLQGNDVVITWVYLRADSTDIVRAFSDVYQILLAEVDDNSGMATFEVGKQNLLNTTLPRNRYIDFRCGHVYKSIEECNYGRDEFKGISNLDLKLGGDGLKSVQGWRALNMANCDIAKINLAELDRLLIQIATGTNCTWKGAAKTGPFVYRLIKCADTVNVLSDFTLETCVSGDGNEVEETEGILLCTDSDTSSDWLIIARRVLSGSTLSTVVMKNVSGTETTVYSGTGTECFQIVKTGTTFTFNAKTNPATTSWTQVASTTHAGLHSTNVRAGCFAGSGASSRGSVFNARFEYFYMTGGYKTCNRSLEDCRARENVRRIRAMPGILHGALNL